MPRHDPIPPRLDHSLNHSARAWLRYRRLMLWMAVAAIAAVLLALLYLKRMGAPLPLPMVIATIAGVGLSVLLGTGLMGLVFLSNNSGHDTAASGRDDRDDHR